MDVAGLVVGAVGIVKPLCTTIHDILVDYRGFGKDAERLRLRFAVQQARLDSLDRLLFSEGKLSPAIPDRVIDHLPRRMCHDMLGLLRQLHQLLLQYTALHSQYIATKDDGTQDAEASRWADSVLDMPPAERMKALVLEGKRSDASRQKAASLARKMLWLAVDRSSTERLVNEFEEWTGRARDLLEAAWWPLPFFETVERMRTLEKDQDAREVGLLRGIGIRKVLAAPLTQIPRDLLPLEFAARSFQSTTRVQMLGGSSPDLEASIEIGEIKREALQGQSPSAGRQLLAQAAVSACLVEYRQYGPEGARQAEAVRQLVVKLAALLHVGPPSDELLRMLPVCVGFFHDVERSCFGIIYSMPSSFSSPQSLNTLAAVLDIGSKRHAKSAASMRPSLSARARLAHRLAVCLQRLHSYQWLHKSLSSTNVLIFPSAAALDEARIVGFDDTRQETDESDRIADDDARRNIYRHPDRWGPTPVSRFEKVHDIYALGVVLLELGLWSRADQLDDGALVKLAEAYDIMGVKQRLLAHAMKRLGFFAGERYRDVVLACLTGIWETQPVSEGLTLMVEALAVVAKSLSSTMDSTKP